MLVYAIMPRKATVITQEVVTARATLRAFLDTKICSQTRLSSLANAKQFAISRFLSGRTKTITPEIQVVLDIINNGIANNAQELFNDQLIRGALGRAWDGTQDGKVRIAVALNALAPILLGRHSRK